MDKIDNELELVETFEIGELGRVTCAHKRFKPSADKRARSAAQHSLLAEKIGLRFFAKARFHHASARAADTLGPSQAVRFAWPLGFR